MNNFIAGQGVPFAGTSSPNNILTRQETVQTLSETQQQIDETVTHFVDQATEWQSLASMAAGGLAYRFGKIGFLSWGARATVQSPLLSPLVKGGSTALGLTFEVTAFELTHRTLQTFFQSPITNHQSPNLWSWSGPQGIKQGWLSSLVTFATLKGFGKIAEGQNLILQHGMQDLGMVGGHHLLFHLGLGERPEGSFSEQLARAEVTNLQMGAGMALGQTLSGGTFSAWEKSLDLSLSLMGRTTLLTEWCSIAMSGSPGDFFSHPTIWMMSAGEGKSRLGERDTIPAPTEARGPSPEVIRKRELLKKLSAEGKIAPDTYLGHLYSKGYRKISEVEEAVELLFGDSTSLEKPIDEIQWIESHQLKGGFPRIRSYLQHPDRPVRTAALRALTGLKPNMLIPELTELLSPYLDPRKALSVGEVTEIEAILGALVQFGVDYETMEQKTRPYLRLLVNHSNREVSTAAEAASVLLKIIPMIPDYRMLMRNGLPEVRIQALSILKALHPPEYQSALKERLSDPDPRVRRLAAETLAYIGGSEVVDVLGVLLNEDGDIEFQKTVAELLGLLRSPRSLSDLTAILEREETDPTVQEASLEALGQLKLPQAFSLFRQFLTHPNPTVAFASAVGLARLGRLNGVDLHFQVLLNSPFVEHRYKALKTLLDLPRKYGKIIFEEIQADAKVPIESLLTDPSPENRRLAAKLLNKYDPSWPKKLGNFP